MDDFEAKSEAFLHEFKSQVEATFHPSLQLTDLRDRGAGRGIIAASCIPADTELFTIPRDYVISVENSELARVLPQIFEDDVADGDEDEALPKSWLNLILVLIHDYLRQANSKWCSYWGVLPHDFNTLMFWTENEINELQASSVRGRIGKDSADQMFKTQIIPVVQRHENIFYPPGIPRMHEDELMTLAHRMGSLIMAYAFDLEKDKEDSDDEEGEDGWAEDREGQTAMGMVPMADMLNADAEFNAHLEHGVSTLTMRSLRTIRAGEEVLNYYGPLPNSDLLRRYGYTSQKHSRYDVIEISWTLIKRAIDEYFERDIQIPSSNGDDFEEGFVLERESGDPDETGVNESEAKFTTFPEELVEQVSAFTTVALGIKTSTRKSSEHEKKQSKHAFLQVITRAISARLTEYGTSIEQDEALLTKSGIDSRLKMAIDMRLGEKRLLREAHNLAQGLLSTYSDVNKDSNTNGGSEGPPQKRQKRSR